MTAIAFRDGVMAGDTRIELEFLKTTEPKVVKRKGYLIGVSGEKCPHMSDVLRWFFAEVDAPKRPSLRGCSFEAMIVTPAGQIQLWDHNGLCYPVPPSAAFWATGSGAECCMGAMEMGATSEQAVAAAIKWQKDCGGSITKVRLNK